MKKNKKQIFAALGDVDDKFVAESELILDQKAHGNFHRFIHFWNTAAGVILLCVLVSGVILSGIIYAGWDANHLPSANPTETDLSIINHDAPVERQGDLFYINHGDGTCTLVGIAALPEDMTLTIPEKTPNGETVIAIADMTTTSPYVNVPNGAHLFHVQQIHIPASVRSIHIPTLHAMTNLSTLTVAENNPYYFADDIFLYQREGSVLVWARQLIAGQDFVWIRVPTSGVPSLFQGTATIAIPDFVNSIAKNAFYRKDSFDICRLTVTFCIPASVVTIEDGFCNWNGSTLLFEVDPNNPAYRSEDGCLIQKSNDALIGGYQSSIPSSIKSIAPYAYNQTVLSNITIPSSITKIGYMAMADAQYLTAIHFQGTKAEWDAVQKDETWLEGNQKDIMLYCSDLDEPILLKESARMTEETNTASSN